MFIIGVKQIVIFLEGGGISLEYVELTLFIMCYENLMSLITVLFLMFYVNVPYYVHLKVKQYYFHGKHEEFWIRCTLW